MEQRQWTRHLEPAAQLLVALAAIAALLVTAWQIRVQTTQTDRANSLAGRQFCMGYREHLLDLYDRGMSPEEITALLDDDRAYVRFVDECGEPHVLLDGLKRADQPG